MSARWPLAALVVVASSLCACGGGVRVALSRPSAALYDEVADVYLVANLGGDAGGASVHVVSPENGEVSALVTPDEGLRAPRGLALVGRTLWVADVDVLRTFDRVTGAPRGVTPIPGAASLWGLTAGADGTVYVSDAGAAAATEPTASSELSESADAGAIWKVPPGGVPEVLARGQELAGTTSISAQRGGLYAVNARDGQFCQVDYRGVRTELGRAPQAGLCGLVRVPGAPDASDPRLRTPSWMAASRDGAAVYRFALTGGVQALPIRAAHPGDLGYDRRRRRLLVPLTNDHRLLIEPL